MKQGFYSKKSALGVPNALILLMLIFFFVPFAGRGARMALQRTENNVKDWLPSDFRETEELAWFAKRFVSEQFILATWNGCHENDQRLKMFISKLAQEIAPPADSDPSSDYFRAKKLGAEYALFAGDDDFYNWGGKEEKWLQDENGKSYYVTPNGRLYRWEGNPNVVSALWRVLTRATGSFTLDGQFVAAFGDPGTEENPNPFWADPRLLTAPLFKTIESGPDVVAQLSGAGGSLATPTEPTAGEREAIARLTGTLFGPPVPAGFTWLSNDLPGLLNDDKVAELPEGWQETWDLIVQSEVDQNYDGDLEAFRRSDPIDQSTVWYDFFDAIGIEEPERQTCVVLTLSEPARRNLGRVIGRGMMGQTRGRLFDIGEECGVAAPAIPSAAPPPFSWMAAKEAIAEPVIHIGGPPVDNVAIDEEGTITLVRLIGYSLALGLGLSYLLLRSMKLMFMVFFVGGTSALASLSLVWWCNASVDAILLTMPSLIYVLGMAGAVHIVNYYRDAVQLHGPDGAPERAISHAVMPCTLAAVTTAIGLLSLCTSNILPIRKFGIFSAMGVMTTLVLLYLYLPSALTVFPPKENQSNGKSGNSTDRIARMWEAIGGFILRRHWWVNAVCIGAFICLGIGLTKIQTSVQLLKLFDSKSQIIKDYAWLEENFGRLVPMELVVRFPTSLQRPSEVEEGVTDDELRSARLQLSLLERAEAVSRIQQVLQDQFGYEGEDIVGRGMSAITFLRDIPDPSRGFDAQRTAFDRLLHKSRDELLKSDYLAVESAKESQGTELWRISLRLGALNDVDYGQFVSTLRTVVEPVVTSYRVRRAVLQSIVTQAAQADSRVVGNVLVLGHGDPRAVAEIQSPSDAPQDANKNPIDTMAIFARTLSGCLTNESIGVTKWHDPRVLPLSDEEAVSEKWADYVKRFSCVIILNPHPDYDLDFIRAAHPCVIDASQMLASAVQDGNQESQQAISQPVTLSRHEGEMDVVYTGVVPVVYKAQRTLLISLIESVAWAFVLIGVVMMCLLSPARTFMSAFAPGNMLQAMGSGLISMIPNVFPLVIIFGAMGHMGSLVDIGSMMTASVAMGIAVDDTIHFLTWFREGLRRGLDRREAIFVAYKHVAPAMTQTTIIGGLGLSVFALSTFTPTQRFGTLMLSLLGAALVGDLIFLPALLASPLGRIFTVRPLKKPTDGANTSDSANTGDGDDFPPTVQYEQGEYRLVEESSPASLEIRAPKMMRMHGPHVRRR
jgi:predicted RND superfamily exporter protein